jgi:hypothetical protein
MLPSRCQLSFVGHLTWIIQSLLDETLQPLTSLNVNFNLKNINLLCTDFRIKLLNWCVLCENLGLWITETEKSKKIADMERHDAVQWAPDLYWSGNSANTSSEMWQRVVWYVYIKVSSTLMLVAGELPEYTRRHNPDWNYLYGHHHKKIKSHMQYVLFIYW